MAGNFRADLAFGKIYEKIAMDLLGEGTIEYAPNGKFSPWDFKHDNVSYEIKADRRGAKTGNFAIEYENYGRHSGLSTTEADFWVLFMVNESGYECYKIPTDILRTLCINCGRKSQTPNGVSKFHLLAISGLAEYKWK